MKRMISAIFLFLLTWSPAVEAQAPFYQGKTITFITGSPAGDLFDLYVRTVGQFLVKHIPGNPDVIVQNMPGAGHIIAANYVYNIAKPDGLTLAGTLATLYIDQLIGQPEVKYDWAKFTWIGNAGKSPMLLYMRADSPYKTIDEVRNAKEPPKCGTTGISNSGYVVPKLLEETIGGKVQCCTRLPGRRCHRPGGGERRGGVPRLHHRGLLLARAFSHVAQERVCADTRARRKNQG